MANADIVLRIRQQGVAELKQMALGFVSLTSALGVAASAAHAFEESFKFRAQLDANNRAIAIQLKGVRDVGRTFQEARAFGDQYKLTQEEVTAALQTSVGVLRQSRSSIADTIGTLERLRIASPEQSIEGAALALKELASGSTSSIVTRFEVSRTRAREMKEEIAAGGDAVQILSKYLDDAGIGMDALKARTEGAAGRLKDLEIEGEKAKLALSGQEGGIGAGLLELRIRGQIALQRIFSGSIIEGAAQTARANYATAQSQLAYNDAIRQGATEVEAQTEREKRYREVVEQTRSIQERVSIAIAAASDAAAAAAPQHQGLAGAHSAAALSAREQADAENALTSALNAQRKGEQGGPTDVQARLAREKAERERAEDLANAPANRAALSDQRAGERSGGAARSATELTTTANLARDKARRIEEEQERLAKSRERLAKTHTSELGKQLRLSESIYDSEAKRYRAALDAEESAIRDRQERRKEDQELRIASNALANAKDPRFRAAAADQIALVDVHRRQRAFDLGQQQATAGGAIIGGKLLQSVGGGGPAIGPRPGGPAAGGAPGAPVSGAAAGGQLVQTIIMNLDGQIIAQVVAPFIYGGLIEGHAQSNAGGGGRPTP